MTWWIAAAIVAGPAWTMDVEMTSTAHLAPQVLERAREEVTRIFADAGLVLRWTERTTTTGATPRVRVNIVPQVLGYDRVSSPVMGVALRGASGPIVQVFLKQVQNFARTYDVDLGAMLAHVIAHEIGHVLLPGKAHSSSGLMQAEWGKAVVRDASRGRLTFTETQAAKIRAPH